MHPTAKHLLLATALSCSLNLPQFGTRASAAIPSISEYDAVQYRKKAPAVPAGAAAPVDIPLGPLAILELVRTSLARLEHELDARNLEAVRTILREPAFATGLGYSPGVRGNAGNLKASATLTSAGADDATLKELLLTLKRLDDFCLSNRVIIFNQEDLDQVKSLMASSGKDGSEGGKLDVTEAKEALADARSLLAEAMESIGSGAPAFGRLRGGSCALSSPRLRVFALLVSGTAMAATLPTPPAMAYQDLASIQAEEFQRAEQQRAAAAQRSSAARLGFEQRVAVVEVAFAPGEFIAACDALALYVIGQGRLPEGANAGAAIGRIRSTYNALPKSRVPCELLEGGRGGTQQCCWHGEAVEAAYSALLRELKKYARRGLDTQMSGGTELPNFPGGGV